MEQNEELLVPKNTEKKKRRRKYWDWYLSANVLSSNLKTDYFPSISRKK